MSEKLKSGLLFFLFGLMIVLFYISLTMGLHGVGDGRFAGFFHKAQHVEPALESDAAGSYQAAATPLKIAIRGDGGLYMPQGAAKTEESFKQIEPVYNEAIGSAGAPEKVTKHEYLDSLQKPSIYVGYDMPVPVYMLRMWAGFEFSDEQAQLQRVLLCEKDGEVVMYFIDSKSNQYFCSKTAASLERLVQICLSTEQANSIYAFEAPEFGAFAPDEPIFTGNAKMETYSILPPVFSDTGEVPRQTLLAFGFNPYLTKTYEDVGSSIVYVEGFKALKMSPGGDLTFTANSDEGIPMDIPVNQSNAQEKTAAAVEFSRRVVTEIWSRTQGGGVLSLDGMSVENGVYEMQFEILLNGAFVWLKEGAAANVKIENNSIVYMKLSPRRFSVSGEAEVLPFEQAAAALSGRHNIRPAVRYLESEKGVLKAIPAYVK